MRAIICLALASVLGACDGNVAVVPSARWHNFTVSGDFSPELHPMMEVTTSRDRYGVVCSPSGHCATTIVAVTENTSVRVISGDVRDTWRCPDDAALVVTRDAEAPNTFATCSLVLEP